VSGYLRNRLLFGAVLGSCFLVARSCGQELPNPDHIRLVQERTERERAVARRIEYHLARAPKPEPEKPQVRPLSDEERRELVEAIDRFIREGRGLVNLDPRGGVR